MTQATLLDIVADFAVEKGKFPTVEAAKQALQEVPKPILTATYIQIRAVQKGICATGTYEEDEDDFYV